MSLLLADGLFFSAGVFLTENCYREFFLYSDKVCVIANCFGLYLFPMLVISGLYVYIIFRRRSSSDFR